MVFENERTSYKAFLVPGYAKINFPVHILNRVRENDGNQSFETDEEEIF